MENENQKTFLKPNTTLDCDLFSRADLMFPTRTSKSKCNHEQKKGTPIYIYFFTISQGRFSIPRIFRTNRKRKKSRKKYTKSKHRLSLMFVI